MKNNKDFPELTNYNWLCDFCIHTGHYDLNVFNTVTRKKRVCSWHDNKLDCFPN